MVLVGQPAKFPCRESRCQISERFPSPSQALELPGSSASKETGSAPQGDKHGDSSLSPPTCGSRWVQGQAVRSPCPSGLRVAGLVAPPLESAAVAGLGKASPESYARVCLYLLLIFCSCEEVCLITNQNPPFSGLRKPHSMTNKS